MTTPNVDPFDDVTIRVEYTPSHVSFYNRLRSEVQDFANAVHDEHPTAIVEIDRQVID